MMFPGRIEPSKKKINKLGRNDLCTSIIEYGNE